MICEFDLIIVRTTSSNFLLLFRYTYNNDIAILKLNMTKDDPLYNKMDIIIPENHRISVGKS